MKPTAFIHGWMYWQQLNVLIGRISDHPRQDEFHGLQQTSQIIAAPDGFKPQAKVETMNTFYILCGPWAEQQEKERTMSKGKKAETREDKGLEITLDI